MATPTETVQQITDKINAMERAARRTVRLAEDLHEMLAEAAKTHGPSLGVAPTVIAPKD